MEFMIYCTGLCVGEGKTVYIIPNKRPGLFEKKSFVFFHSSLPDVSALSFITADH